MTSPTTLVAQFIGYTNSSSPLQQNNKKRTRCIFVKRKKKRLLLTPVGYATGRCLHRLQLPASTLVAAATLWLLCKHTLFVMLFSLLHVYFLLLFFFIFIFFWCICLQPSFGCKNASGQKRTANMSPSFRGSRRSYMTGRQALPSLSLTLSLSLSLFPPLASH